MWRPASPLAPFGRRVVLGGAMRSLELLRSHASRSSFQPQKPKFSSIGKIGDPCRLASVQGAISGHGGSGSAFSTSLPPSWI